MPPRKKPSAGGPTRKPRTDDEVRVRLDLPAAYHQRLRVVAATAGVSMAEYARQLMMDHLDGKKA